MRCTLRLRTVSHVIKTHYNEGNLFWCVRHLPTKNPNLLNDFTDSYMEERRRYRKGKERSEKCFGLAEKCGEVWEKIEFML